MAGGALDYVVRMEWGGSTAHYGPYNEQSARRIAGLCNQMARQRDQLEAAVVIELLRYIDPSPGSLDEPVRCRNCGEVIT